MGDKNDYKQHVDYTSTAKGGKPYHTSSAKAGCTPMSAEKTWVGDVPTACDLCSAPITNAFVDGATYANSPGRARWANMCLKCHQTHGVGLGSGVGQQYEKRVTKALSATGDTVWNITLRQWERTQWVKVRG